MIVTILMIVYIFCKINLCIAQLPKWSHSEFYQIGCWPGSRCLHVGGDLAEYHVKWTDKTLDENLNGSTMESQLMQGESTLLTIHVYHNTCLISVQDNQYALYYFIK